MKEPYVIQESFFALKAVYGTRMPPIGSGEYGAMMRDHAWHIDPRLGGHTERVSLCERGWHAFPLDRLVDWWRPIGNPPVTHLTNPPKRGKRGERRERRERRIWIVEMFGKAEFSQTKMCASHIRFVEELSPTELDGLSMKELHMVSRGWGYDVQQQFRREAQRLRMEGLVWMGMTMPIYGPLKPRLLRVGAPRNQEAV